MQPAPDKANTDDSESLFDFLEGDQNKPADQSVDNTVSDNSGDRPRRVAPGDDTSAEKPFPVIRKPVSVSRTGPLKAPRPGDPVEPPPGLTDGIRKSDAPETHRRAVPQPDTDLSELDDLDEIDLGEVDLDFDQDEWPSSDSWIDKSHRPVPVNYQPARTSVARKAGYFLAFALIACGTAYALIGVPSVQQWTASAFNKAKETIQGFSGDASPSETLTTDSTLATAPVDAAPAEVDAVPAVESAAVDSALVPTEASAPKTLNELFREQLSQLEVLLQNGSLDAAEQAIQDMDRSVYGYGAPEFTEIKERIATLRQGDTSQPELTPPTQNTQAGDQLTEQQRIVQEAGQIEQEELARAERQAAEAAQAEAARAEAARAEAEQAEAAQQQREAELAAEQQRAATEAARLESVRAEEQRLAEEAERTRLQQAEVERAAAEAAQIRADRVAQEQARQEQLALALQERARLDQQGTPEQGAADDANQQGDWQVVTPGTSDQTVQQLAASQREAARQQRLIEARQREEQTAGSQPPSAVVEPTAQDSVPAAAPETVVALAEPEPIVENTAPAPITDADLQQVYGQFAQLKNAIESRDINTVIALTQRSGVRIQQVMQMFENNVAITARLRNVSTLDAAGEIQGTLQITRLERADGAVTGPPQSFSSVRLSSIRDGDGWSSIRW